MNDEYDADTTPESLMDMFKGPSMIKMVILTVVVHVVVIMGTSLPYLKNELLGANTKEMSKDDRIKAGVEDASAAIRKIAEDHNLSPQDISDQFGSGKKRPVEAPEAGKDDAKTGDGGKEADPNEPTRVKSQYETNLETKVKGPKVPTFDDKKDDIF